MQTNRSAITAVVFPIVASLTAGNFLLTDPDGATPAGPSAVVTPLVTSTTSPPTASSAHTTPLETSQRTVTMSESEPAAPPTTTRPVPPSPESSFVGAPVGEPHPDLGSHVCIDADPVDALPHVFDSELPLAGADYQRAFPLPDGRVLWLFQDAFLDTPTGRRLVHNVALLQSGSCFQLLHGGDVAAPTPYLYWEVTEPHQRWFWPLGGEIGDDGLLYVFVAEMHEHSGRYLGHVEPVATWLVSFGWDPFPSSESTVGTHDWDCTADVTVARVPRGRLDVEPEYWDGAQWTNDASAAVAVIPTEGRVVNPTQVAVVDDRFIAVTKVDDWWGTDIHLDVAPSPFGPWTTHRTVTVEARCGECNAYFASIVPFGASDGTLTIAVSNNHWFGDVIEHYRPSVLDVAFPS